MTLKTNAGDAARVSHDNTHEQHRKLTTSNVVEMVRDNPGFTSAELAQETGADRFMMARRLPDAEKLKSAEIYKGTTRVCRKTGRPAFTWWPMPVQKSQVSG